MLPGFLFMLVGSNQSAYGQCFSTPTSYSAGTTPQNVASGDFNGDGKPDLAVANYLAAGAVSVLLNNGSGGFDPVVSYPTGAAYSVDVAIGDLNGDSKPDLVASNLGSSNNGTTVSVLLNNGNGGFGAATRFPAGQGPVGEQLGDFNGDGKLDLAVTNAAGNAVSVLLGDGAGGFSAPTIYPVGTYPQGIALADFNSDGKLDMAVANQASNNISILLNTGSGEFSAATNTASGGTGTHFLAKGDFNGDGKFDLVATNVSSNNVSVLLGNGSGGFSAPIPYPVGSAPYSVAVGDFNGDGQPDLGVANISSNTVSIRLNKNDGSGGFGSLTNIPIGPSPGAIAVTEFNGDGFDDVAVSNSNNTVSIVLGRSTSIITQPVAGSAVCVGGTVTATVSATSTGALTYQWYKGGTSLGVAQQSATLSLSTIQTTDAGSYSVVVTGDCFSLTSTAFSLTVNASPSISIDANPSLTITQGSSTTLTASGADSYSWSTGESTAIMSVSVAGPYSVMGISSGCSSTTSVIVTVNAPLCGAGLSGPIWTGCLSTDWNTAGNWASGTVPATTDDVLIPSSPTNQPILSTNGVAKSVEVQSGASLSITASGSLVVNDSKSIDGFTTAFSNLGTVQNAGQLILGNTAALGLFGIWNRGQFNNLGGQVSIDRSTAQALRNDPGTFSNSGTLKIGTLADVGEYGVVNEETATFQNNTSGLIQIDRSTTAALRNTSSFVNSATITIGASITVGQFGIHMPSGFFQNNAGSYIQIDRASTAGLANSGAFANSSAIRIGSLAYPAESGLQNPGSFTNNAGGTIQIDRTGYEALSSYGNFTNVGGITIGALAPTGANGVVNGGNFTNAAGSNLHVDQAGVAALVNFSNFINSSAFIIGASNMGERGISNQGNFTNTAGGNIVIDRTTAVGIINQNTFINSASITIGSSATVGNASSYGLGNSSSFTNTTGGSITIDRTLGNGLSNSGQLLNEGGIAIGQTGTIGANGITNTASTTLTNQGEIRVFQATAQGLNNAGTVANLACSVLSLSASVNNGGTLTNAGLFTVNTAQAHTNTGSLTNNGIIDYPQGNPISNVLNNDVIVSAITSCNTTFSPALQLGGNSSQFTIGTSWYSDQALTQPAGAYDRNSNTFTATNLASGSSATLYFAATDNTNGCTKTLSVSVTRNAMATVSITPSAMTVCAGTPVSLTATEGSSYLWNTGQITQTITVATDGASGPTGIPGSPTGPDGPYSVTVTSAGGCSASATITLTVNAIPMASISPTNQTVCAGIPVSLTASGGSVYQWSSGETTAMISVTATGTYSVTVSGTTGPTGATGVSGGRVAAGVGCYASASTTVTINPAPSVSINPSSTTLTNASPSVSLTAVGTGTYLWSTGATTQVISATTSGTYSVTLTNASGCKASARVPVIGSDLTVTLDLPQANFGASGTAAVGNFVVNVFEVAGLPTSSGNVRITVTAPIGYTLAFPPSQTSIQVSGGGTTAVNNGQWTVTTNLVNRQITLTMASGAFIGAGGESSLGFVLTRTTASSGSTSNVTVNVVDDLTMSYDGNLANNGYARIISGL